MNLKQLIKEEVRRQLHESFRLGDRVMVNTEGMLMYGSVGKVADVDRSGYFLVNFTKGNGWFREYDLKPFG